MLEDIVSNFFGWFQKNPDAGLSRIDYTSGNRPPKIASIDVDKVTGSLPFKGKATVDAKDPENDFTGLDYLCNNQNFKLLEILLAKKIYSIDKIYFSACEVHSLNEKFIDFVYKVFISYNNSMYYEKYLQYKYYIP